jgi:SRSO17 transposase
MYRTQTHHRPELAFQYAKGLFQGQKRNMERMCERVADSEYHQIHHFISESPWSAREVFDTVALQTSEVLSTCGKVGLLIDESSHLKKGTKSVGVARQYSGTIGKVDNCQVAVYAGLSSGNHYGLIDTALYLPKEWTTDTKRCKKAGIPEAHRKYKTKPELALDIVKRQKANGVKFDWVGGDGLYGNAPDFLQGLDMLGLLFVIDVHSDQRIYTQPPLIKIPEAKPGRGRNTTSYKCEEKSVEVRQFAAAITDNEWHNIDIREGTKGTVKCKAHVCKVYTWQAGAPTSVERVLVIRKTQTATGEEMKYALSNAKDGQYSTKELVQMQAQRYFVERSFQDAKEQMGMSQYQVRGWLAWHHHMALVMRSMQFILNEKILFQKEIPLLSAYDIREVMANLYARKGTTYDEVMAQMKQRHKQRQDDIERNRGDD